jgi:hypothetical protein
MLLAILALPLSAEPPSSAKKPADDKIPFMCFTDAWTASYKLVGSRYDRKKKQLIWMLETKKPVFPSSYEAFFGDGDGLQLATFNIAFSPKPTKALKPGTRIEAIVSFKDDVNIDDVAKVTIRENR